MSETTTEHDLTEAEWRAKHRVTPAVRFKLRRLGLMPEMLDVPGCRLRTVTPEADRAWVERMREYSASEQMKLERQRRVEQARAAAKLAVESPKHISNRRRSRKR